MHLDSGLCDKRVPKSSSLLKQETRLLDHELRQWKALLKQVVSRLALPYLIFLLRLDSASDDVTRQGTWDASDKAGTLGMGSSAAYGAYTESMVDLHHGCL